jgi:hypothetical protein
MRLIGGRTIELVVLFCAVGKDEPRLYLPQWHKGALHRLGIALALLDCIPPHLRITVVNGDRLSPDWRQSADQTRIWVNEQIKGGIAKIKPKEGVPTIEELLALVNIETLKGYRDRVGRRQYEFEMGRRPGWYQEAEERTDKNT